LGNKLGRSALKNDPSLTKLCEEVNVEIDKPKGHDYFDIYSFIKTQLLAKSQKDKA